MYIIIYIFLFYYALVLLLSTLPIGVHTYQLVYIFIYVSVPNYFSWWYVLSILSWLFYKRKEYIFFLNQKEQNIKKAN